MKGYVQKSIIPATENYFKMTILDGKKVSNDIKDEIAGYVKTMVSKGEKVPHLAAILVGSDGASMTYVNAKVKACERIGFNSTLIELPEYTSEEELLEKIHGLNTNDDIDGFIVQLPLPDQIDEQKVLSKNLEEITKEADIVVAAIGISEFLTGDMVKEDVVIIDVGITRVPDATKKNGYRLAGDVHFESVSQKASYITPVPGGVGPMTIAMLLKNTLLARERHNK